MRRFCSSFVAASFLTLLVFLAALLYADEKEAKEAYNRGIGLFIFLKLDEAIAAYTDAIEKGPGTEYEALARNGRSLIYSMKGQYDAAIADSNRAIQLLEEIETRKAYKVSAYVNRGFTYHSTGQYERAIADFSKAIELEPKDAGHYNQRGKVYSDKGQYTEAIADLSKALELDAKSATAYNNRGIAYFHKGQYDAALVDYDKAIELHAKAAEAWNNKGRALTKMGRLAEAIDCHHKAIEINSAFTRAIAYKGFAFEKMGKKEEAKEVYRQALKVDVDEAAYVAAQRAWQIYGRALAYGRLGDKENCFKALKTSIQLLPSLKDKAKREELLEEYWDGPDFKAIVK